MRTLFLAFLPLIFMVTTCWSAETVKANPRTMVFAGLKYDIPKSERVLLECGIPVYLLRDSELPIISMSAMVRTGSVYETAAKSGLASLTGSVMRSGGAGGIAPDAMNDELEFMASSVESHITEDIGTVSLTTLSRKFPRTLELFAAVLLKPDFNEKRVDIARKQLIEGIRRQNDDPKQIAAREIERAIYAGHPLGNVATLESATSITRQDMIQFHRRFFRVDNMILTVAGDFDRNETLRLLNAAFKKPADLMPLALPEIPQPKQEFRGEVIYGKKEVNQSVIRMGHLGVTKDSPDLYALRMLNYILGGSFTSRLMMEIRTNQGLAYNVGSQFDIGRRFTGSFIAETETKGESTGKAIRLMQEIISGITKAPVTDQELSAARDYIINSFMFGFTAPSSIVVQQARLEFYGYSPDYLDTYREKISKVTKDDLLKAAQKHLKPEAFKLVVVGDDAKLDVPLKEFGPVRQLELQVNRASGGK